MADYLSVALAWVLYSIILFLVIGSVYRLYISPIAYIPGPKLAALTFWYEFYYDVVLGGQYAFHIRKLHEKYGPIIRINPFEIHISDPLFYDVLYTSSASGEKRDKWGWYTKQFGTPTSMIATASHDQHKIRRAALNRFFSTASVRRLQPLLDERLDRLLSRVHESKGTGKAIPLEYAFSAFTSDVIMEYAYGESDGHVDSDDWGAELHDAIVEGGKGGLLMKQMIWIWHLIDSLPHSIQSALSPGLGVVLRLHRHVETIIAGIKKQPASTYADLSHPTIFHEILQNESLPDSDKSVLRLKHEALIVVAAGTVTTSWALCVAVFNLLRLPNVLSKLKQELESAIPDAKAVDRVPLARLESLRYLTAVIQEALRLSYGVASRLQRISPDKPLVYTDKSNRGWVIPPGTPVSMTSVLIHHNEDIFPDSYAFRPERWLSNADDIDLTRYMVSFSKGSRQCLGINLAYAEMYLVLSAIFRRYGSAGVPGSSSGMRHEDDLGVLELEDASEREVRVAADGFVPLRDPAAKGIRVHIRP